MKNSFQDLQNSSLFQKVPLNKMIQLSTDYGDPASQITKTRPSWVKIRPSLTLPQENMKIEESEKHSLSQTYSNPNLRKLSLRNNVAKLDISDRSKQPLILNSKEVAPKIHSLFQLDEVSHNNTGEGSLERKQLPSPSIGSISISKKEYNRTNTKEMSDISKNKNYPNHGSPISPRSKRSRGASFHSVNSEKRRRKLSVDEWRKQLGGISPEKNENNTRSSGVYETIQKRQSSFQRSNSLRDTVQTEKIIIYPDDTFKKIWEIIIALILLFAAIVTPYRISFVDYDNLEWLIIDSAVDIAFTIDLIINFLSAYIDEDDNIIIDRKKIAIHYITGWFWIDFVSIIPCSLILNIDADYNSMARLSKLPKIYRLLKLTKLARMLKMAKQKSRFISFIYKFLKVQYGFDKLIFFVIILLLICHISACLWYLLAKIENFTPETWIVRYNLIDKSNQHIYIASYFWAVTMITAMGESGIQAETENEMIMSIIMLCVGVTAYSYTLGSLTSMLTSLDSKEGKLKTKIHILDDIRMEYKLQHNTYSKMKKALKYDHSRDERDRFEFLNQLPKSLSIELALIMFSDMIQKIPFFQKRNPHFITFIGSLLKPLKVMENDYIFTEGDPSDEMFFLVKGSACFVTKDMPDYQIVSIEEGNIFGDCELVTSGPRKFTVKALEDCELLVLNKNDLPQLKIHFPNIYDELFSHSKDKETILSQYQDNSKQALGSLFTSRIQRQGNIRRNPILFSNIRVTLTQIQERLNEQGSICEESLPEELSEIESLTENHGSSLSHQTPNLSHHSGSISHQSQKTNQNEHSLARLVDPSVEINSDDENPENMSIVTPTNKDPVFFKKIIVNPASGLSTKENSSRFGKALFDFGNQKLSEDNIKKLRSRSNSQS